MWYATYEGGLCQDKLGVFKDVDYYSVLDMQSGTEMLVSTDTVTPAHTWQNDQLLNLMESLPDIDTLLDETDFDVPAAVSLYDVMTDDGKVEKRFVFADRRQPALIVGPDCTCLTLYLTSFNHVNAPRIRFAVRVDGFDGEWVCLAPGENVFRLMNLPKGDYRIWLCATDDNGL